MPHDESKNLALRFEQLGVNHEFLSLEGVGHGFAGAETEAAERVEATVAEFLQANVR